MVSFCILLLQLGSVLGDMCSINPVLIGQNPIVMRDMQASVERALKHSKNFGSDDGFMHSDIKYTLFHVSLHRAIPAEEPD